MCDAEKRRKYMSLHFFDHPQATFNNPCIYCQSGNWTSNLSSETKDVRISATTAQTGYLSNRLNENENAASAAFLDIFTINSNARPLTKFESKTTSFRKTLFTKDV